MRNTERGMRNGGPAVGLRRSLVSSFPRSLPRTSTRIQSTTPKIVPQSLPLEYNHPQHRLLLQRGDLGDAEIKHPHLHLAQSIARLEDALALHSREILRKVFSWSEGDYSFEEESAETRERLAALLASLEAACPTPERLAAAYARAAALCDEDVAINRAIGGHGLGLAIVKRMVEAHGWRIQAASDPGRGATMTISAFAVATIRGCRSRIYVSSRFNASFMVTLST